MAFGWTLFVIPFVFVFSGRAAEGDPLSIRLDFRSRSPGAGSISAA